VGAVRPIHRGAEKFADRGVGHGDVVCVELPNCAAHVLSTLAAWRFGATVVPLRPVCKERLPAFKVPGTQEIVVEIGLGCRQDQPLDFS
jgi:acyl-CoA synthetase (AMP-forming)/AMP-acid ligase II